MCQNLKKKKCDRISKERVKFMEIPLGRIKTKLYKNI